MKKYTLLLLLMFVVASGGCGGGSSGSPSEDSHSDDTTPKVSVEFDSDGDGVPDVFSYYTAGYSDGRNAPGNGEAYDVPYLNYIASSDTDEQGSFTAKIYLERGKAYVMKYSHSGRTLGDNDIDFRILTPDEKELAFDLGLSSTEDDPAPAEAQEVTDDVISMDANTQLPEGETTNTPDTSTEQEYLTVKAQLEILPEENPCMIFYTFTAPQTGTYSFTLREKEYFPTSQDVPYELRIYDADDDSALKLGSITMTPRDALDLQRVLLSYADKFNADGLPVKFTQEFVSNDVYNTMIQSLAEKSINAARVQAAADEGTSIHAYISDIPYYEKYQPGAGFYADSGLLAATFDAFENFTLPRPASGEALPVETYYSSHEVMTEEEHTREQNLAAMTTFALVDNALGVAPMTATNVRLGQLTKSIMIVYNKIESTPRLIDPQTLKFNQIANSFLSQGDAQTFREEYGDYFVAGYRWGMTFKASISVTCTDSSILDKVCNTVSAAMLEAATNKSADKSSAALTNTINNLAKSGYVNIEIDRMVINGSDPDKSTFNMNASLSTVVDSLRTFAAELPTAPRSRFTPVQVYLMRYREIPSAHEIIPAKLPVKQSLFNAVRNMTETIFRTRCVYNSLMAIPIDHIRNGSALQKEWKNEFEKLIDETKYGTRLSAIVRRRSQATRQSFRLCATSTRH